MNYSIIIAEFNPFTLGHKKIIQATKKLFPNDGIVVIMSGNFVQRGEPAICDKYTRAKVATEMGVDLVIELPLIYSISSADDFAFGGISLANFIPNAKRIVFGSECGDITTLKTALNSLKSTETQSKIKSNLKNGLSFASSTIKAATQTGDLTLSRPNNILALSYLKALESTKSSLEPITIKRDDNYNDLDLNSTPSASALRASINSNQINSIKDKMPTPMYKAITSTNIPNINDLFPLLFLKITSLSSTELKSFININEGLEHKIKKEILTVRSFEELVDNLSSKRYPKSKIKRILLRILFEISKKDEFDQKKHPYLKVLAANKKHETLKDLSNATIPVLTQSKDFITKNNLCAKLISREFLADNIYALISGGKRNMSLLNKL